MTAVPLVPAELAFAGDGSPYSTAYEDIYHAVGGGLAQARHVFLGGNGLLGEKARWRGRESFAILECGFGLGSNFLATWQAWRDDPLRPKRLHYFSIEKHPFRLADLARLHAERAEFAEVADLAAQLQGAWPSLVSGFHRLHFEGGQVSLTLVFGAAHASLPSIGGRFDACYLDGFSPAKNPEMWSQALIDDLAWLAAPGATLATWTIAGEIRRRLASADFSVERREGFGFKRDMLVATHPGAPQIQAGACPPRRIAIIGAGIAGVACAERLAARGCEVSLFERREHIAAETSGNHQAILLPVLAVDETRLSRLNRVAFLYALHRLHQLAQVGHPVTWEQCGVFQIARDTAHARKQEAIVRDQRLPEDFVQFITAEQGGQIVGTPVAGPGWWFPRAGWLSPAALAAALLAAGGGRIDCRFGCDIDGLTATDSGWAIHAAGRTVWNGDAVVLAHAHGIRTLPQAAHLPIRCFRGQVSHLPAERLDGLPRTVVCREGYLAPPHAGIAGIGATFQRSHETALSIEDNAANLARLTSMLPGFADRFDPAELDGRVGLRPVSPDKLPLLGALPLSACEPRPPAHVEWPRWPGLFVASGYGARGFVWAPLMAELLASQILDEPLPVEQELAAAVDPARFAWKGIL